MSLKENYAPDVSSSVMSKYENIPAGHKYSVRAPSKMWGKFEKFALRPLFSSVVAGAYAHAQLLRKLPVVNNRAEQLKDALVSFV
jgi:hypothetical protein